MEGASAITAVSSVLASTVKIAEKTFEICAVDTQAKAVLQSVNQVSGQLNDARILRRQKSSVFTAFEKRMIDDTFRHTEEAIGQVASIAERARADMETTGGKVRFNTRLLFVLRDSPNVHVSLTKLGIASQSLNMALFMLTSRDCRSSEYAPVESTPEKELEMKPPPTYEESTFLSERRRKNMDRRASAHSLNLRSKSSSCLAEIPPWPSGNVLELPAEEPERAPSDFNVPGIYVSDHSPEEEKIDFGLFQQATSFTPPPPSRQTWPPPKPILDFQQNLPESDPFSTHNHSRPQRPRAWSSSADLQADELCFGAYQLYPRTRSFSTASLPTQQQFGGKARTERWYQVRCE